MKNKYTLPPEIYVMCANFADQVVETNLSEYASRNQFNREKITNDILYGKLAEWGVYFIYLERGKDNIDPPDMRILDIKDKSFDADLKWNLFKLHVKSQTSESALKYGDSWIFQSKDPLFDFSNEYDIIIGCRVEIRTCDILGNVESVLVEIMLEKPFRSLNFGETKLSKFQGTKKAIYLKDNR